MRKYVVPIAALAGIALLSPRADAANLIIKSRVAPAGHNTSLPVSATGVGGSGQLWGIDFALNFAASGSVLSAVDPNNAFVPQLSLGSPATDVVVTGNTFVGTGATNPSLYVGYLRGTAAIPTTASGTGAPTAAIGLLKLKVAAAAVKNTVETLTVPATYNVANDGTGSTTVSRAGATGVTSTATAGAAVVAEAITVLDYEPGLNAPAAGAPDLRAPLHSVGVGVPGDLNGDGVLGSGDLGNLAAVLVGKAGSTFTPYKRIAADIAPLNGYVPGTSIGGTAGLSYGDGAIGSGDLGLLAAKLVNKASAANFPVAE